MNLRFIPTDAPRLYDAGLANFRPAERYDNAKVRVHVEIPESAVNYLAMIERARQDAQRKFPGAVILVVPRFIAQEKSEIALKLDSTDEEKVRTYVRKTLPEELLAEEERVNGYLLHLLKKVGGVSHLRTTGVRFLKTKAKHTLSFAAVEADFRAKGVQLVLGKNRDWDGSSNGSGKTNLLQLLRVALYGETSKGQKHDGIILRASGSQGSAHISMLYRDDRNNLCQVTRSRKPTTLHFIVNGVDRSSGISTARTGVSTQELIERSVGMTKEVFDHSVLIDQKLLHRARGFLFGTDKDRKDLLSQLLGLERFQDAVELVRKSRNCLTREMENLERVKEKLLLEADDCKADIIRLQSSGSLVQADKEIKRLKKWIASAHVDENDRAQTQKRLQELQTKLTTKEKIMRALLVGEAVVQKATKELTALLKGIGERLNKPCPTCGQMMNAAAVRQLRTECNEKLSVSSSNEREMTKALDAAQKEIITLTRKVEDEQSKLEEFREIISKREALEKQLETWESVRKTSAEAEMVLDLQMRRKHALWMLDVEKCVEHDLFQRRVFLGYAERAFSREGLINFLYETVCQQLNKAAEHYGDVFTGGVLQLRFGTTTMLKSGEERGHFEVEVVNTQGGEAANDQSRGEEQLAALMCVLCLRAIGPKSNLLILDEPSEGLDEVNAKRFADGIEKLLQEIPSIMLATHNELVKSRFRGKQAWVVQKKGGVSELKPWTEADKA